MKQQQQLEGLWRNKTSSTLVKHTPKTILNGRMKSLAQQEKPRVTLDTMDLKKAEVPVEPKPVNDYVSLKNWFYQ